MSTKAAGCIFAICLFASMPAQAAIFKCESAQGRISYSDSPCEDAAAGEKLDKFDRVMTRKVAASVSHRQVTRDYVDGYAYWAKPDKELTAVLYLRALKASELARIAKGERLNISDEESTARVTFLFDEPRPARGTLRHVRSVFTGFSANNPKSPWTSNHRREEITGVLQKFRLGKDDEDDTWLQITSRENSENIRWQIKFALPVTP